MSVFRKLAVVTAATVGVVVFWSAESASALTTSGVVDVGDAAWVCTGTDILGVGVCQDNPLPGRLPVVLRIAEG